MSVINNNLLLTPEGYQISRSVRFRSSASAYLSRAITTTSSLTTFTFSAWVKRGNLSGAASFNLIGNSTNAAGEVLDFYNDTLRWSSYNVGNVISTQVFRDSSAWYHIVVILDTTNATSSSRLRMYVNGVQITTFSTATYPALNSSCQRVNTSGVTNYFGATVAATVPSYFDGYLTEVNFIDGQALTPSSFGETDAVTGVWKPKKYAGTYGTNGFYLNFSDNSAATSTAIGKDMSGNANNWTPNNISVTAGVTYDSMLDVPTNFADGGNGRGNYAVLNPLDSVSGTGVISDGNLKITGGGSTNARSSSILISSGKWYFEATATQVTNSANNDWLGLSTVPNSSTYLRAYAPNGNYYNGSAWAAYGATYTNGDLIGVAFDLDNQTLEFFKNGTSQGQKTAIGLSGIFVCPQIAATGAAGNNISINFGQRPFSYTPPTGFKALNTQNLPEATIKKGNAYFDATTYTGTGGTQTVSNLSFQPDLVWIKNRSAEANHAIVDSVRPSGYAIYPNQTVVEGDNSSLFTGISGNSFGLAGGNVTYNAANNYISWMWKKGATPGFDIVTYTGNGASSRSVSHGLGVAPSMMIFKERNGTGNWQVYHKSLGVNAGLSLNLTNASANFAISWGSAAPTSSAFTVGFGSQNADTNANGINMVGYLFADVAGFSKFGSYVGNGSADGPFVYCGFRPKFILWKNASSGTDGWFMFDASRNTFNVVGNYVTSNASTAEQTLAAVDLLSNGFKLRGSATGFNANGATFIYAAFAENPFKNSLAR